MPKDRDWIDYANLASQVGQNFQLNQLRRGLEGVGAHLNDIARAEQDHEWREQDREWQEDEERDRLRQLREQIFEGSQRLKRLRAQTPQADPRRALVVAVVSVRPPATADLEDYEDKERAQALRDDLEAFTHECEARLSEAEQREVETCVGYLCDQGLLSLLVGYREEKRRLADKRAKREAELKGKAAQLQTLKRKVPTAAREKRIEMLAGIGSLVACVTSIVLGIHFSTTADDPAPFIAGYLVAGLALVPYIAVNSAQNTPARVKAKKEIKDLEEEIARGLGLPVPPNEEVERAAKRFGENLDAAGYRKLFEDRAAFIRGVLGVTGEVPTELADIEVGGIKLPTTLVVDEENLREGRELANGGIGTDEENEELCGRALKVIRATRIASTSTLQRRLRIGFDQANRVMEMLEQRGIVGPENGAQPREILVDLDALKAS